MATKRDTRTTSLRRALLFHGQAWEMRRNDLELWESVTGTAYAVTPYGIVPSKDWEAYRSARDMGDDFIRQV